MNKKINLKDIKTQNIRNFSIIAHIDHGKSTLADRLLEFTGTLSTRTGENKQFLDKLQVEKERGITVKAQTASMFYEYNGETYLLNLIDTPGHVDFNYEVSRSLYACQGALLLVDANQGVEAQTMANFYLAFEHDLKIIPVINKIDIPTAMPQKVLTDVSRLFELPEEDAVFASGKTGIGTSDILEKIIKIIPAPNSDNEKPLKALLFDSWYDDYQGVICLIAIENGSMKKGDQVSFYQNEKNYEVLEIGIMYPEPTSTDILYAGQVGYIIVGMKSVHEAFIGDTIYTKGQKTTPYPGFKKSKPMVFAGIYPSQNNDFTLLADAISKLTLNDASVTTEKKTSTALGLGFRCGFLGLLHMDVFKQRLEQEYDLDIIITAPSVLYYIELNHNKGRIKVENPSDFPDPSQIDSILEPTINATIITPTKYLGAICKLCKDKRGTQKSMEYFDEERVILTYILPLNEVATDFYDELKSLSSGYASFDYEPADYIASDLIKMDILINKEAVDALSCIIHRSKAVETGRILAERIRQAIPRQLFEVIIQAAIGSKILARERIVPLRKDVTQKLYGGDVTRKKKLLEKQKRGKKRMKQVGNVEIPQEAFLAILKK